VSQEKRGGDSQRVSTFHCFQSISHWECNIDDKRKGDCETPLQTQTVGKAMAKKTEDVIWTITLIISCTPKNNQCVLVY
jgi:hypothetical protein